MRDNRALRFLSLIFFVMKSFERELFFFNKKKSMRQCYILYKSILSHFATMFILFRMKKQQHTADQNSQPIRLDTKTQTKVPSYQVRLNLSTV